VLGPIEAVTPERSDASHPQSIEGQEPEAQPIAASGGRTDTSTR